MFVTQPVTVFSNLDELRTKITASPGKWQLAQDVFDAQTNLVFQAYNFLTESNLDLIAALKAKKNHVEDKIYSGGQHMFLGDNNQFRWDQALDAETRTVAFLAKQLGKKK